MALRSFVPAVFVCIIEHFLHDSEADTCPLSHPLAYSCQSGVSGVRMIKQRKVEWLCVTDTVMK